MKKLIKTKAIIDGNNEKPLYEHYFLLEDGLIKAIGNKDDFATGYDDVEIVDLSDYFVMPGLIDCHTHLSIKPELGDQISQLKRDLEINIPVAIENIQKDLLSGVTTLRVMGEEHYLDINIKNKVISGEVIGPDILPSGIGIASSSGHGAGLTTADGIEEIKKLALKNIQQGADHLKLFVTGGVSSTNTSLDMSAYSKEEVSAAVDVAYNNGIYTSAHAHGGEGLNLCIECGVRTIEHGTFVSDNQLERMIKKDNWLISTLTILFDDKGVGGKDLNVPSIYEKLLKAREKAKENLENIIKSGVNLAVGTDSMHGMIVKELEYLTEFGATNFRALQSATKSAAEACKVEDKFGTLEEGKIANFICLKENPLNNISALNRVEKVFKDGREIKYKF